MLPGADPLHNKMLQRVQTVQSASGFLALFSVIDFDVICHIYFVNSDLQTARDGRDPSLCTGTDASVLRPQIRPPPLDKNCWSFLCSKRVSFEASFLNKESR